MRTVEDKYPHVCLMHAGHWFAFSPSGSLRDHFFFFLLLLVCACVCDGPCSLVLLLLFLPLLFLLSRLVCSEYAFDRACACTCVPTPRACRPHSQHSYYSRISYSRLHPQADVVLHRILFHPSVPAPVPPLRVRYPFAASCPVDILSNTRRSFLTETCGCSLLCLYNIGDSFFFCVCFTLVDVR